MAVPLREYTPEELKRLLEYRGYTVAPARRERYRVTGPGIQRPVLIPSPHHGRRLRRDQVRVVLKELGIDIDE